MLVSELQGFLRSLISPLKASGAKEAIVADLEAACLGMEPFAKLPIKDFAAFLEWGKPYFEDGITPVKPKSVRTPSTRAPKAAKPSADDALVSLRTLYDRAGSDEVNDAEIKAEVAKLNALTKADLDAICEQFGLAKGKAKKDSLAAIERKVFSRRATSYRLQSIHE